MKMTQTSLSFEASLLIATSNNTPLQTSTLLECEFFMEPNYDRKFFMNDNCAFTSWGLGQYFGKSVAITSCWRTLLTIFYLCRNPSLWFATKARGLQGGRPRSRPGSHITYSRECKESRECEGMNPHTPKWTPTLGVGESWSPKGTPKTSERDLRGQISMARGVLYINGKLLKWRCLKWSRILHLDIWNTSYGQKKARESNSRELPGVR
jgi:hypothetical protein